MSFALSLLLAAAAPFADLDAIDRAAAAFAGPGTVPVDRRLRLRPCNDALALSWHTQRRDSVVVQCPDAGGWRLFIAVRGNSPAAVAPPAINRGDAVTIAVEGDGFTVSQPGEAMESGPSGAWIRVRTLAAKAEPMRARVVRPGLVSVPLP